MFGLTPAHLILVLIVLLVVVGPGKLPETGAALGKAVRGFRDAMEGRESGAPPAPTGQAPAGQATPAQPQPYTYDRAAGTQPAGQPPVVYGQPQPGPYEKPGPYGQPATPPQAGQGSSLER